MGKIRYMISFLLGCLQLTGGGVFAQHTPARPNIVFILVDDLGNHDLGCTGSTFYETPNIDRIAREGAMLTMGYAASQVCSPSRASIMTGKSPARHGITDYIGARHGEEWRKEGRYSKLLPAPYDTALNHAYTTLPEALKASGYSTFLAGKWHLGHKGSWPEDHGFDVNVGGWGHGGPAGGYFSPWKNPKLENKTPGENLSMRLAEETAHFIKQNNPKVTGQPIFTFLSFYAVHSPIQTTREKWKKYRDKAEKMGIAEKGFEMAKYLPMRQVQDNPVYAGLVETMDDAVGIVLQALEEAGIADNTIIVFTSDNGGVAAGDAFATSNLPLRAGKGYQFEGGIRVPYFIKVPGLANGKQFSTPVVNMDFYPTLLELCGLPLNPDEHTDGKSLVPLLKGGEIEPRSLIWHYPHYGNQGGEPSSIIRKGDWKLIRYYEDGRNELYNLRTDPGEQQDVSHRHKSKTKALRTELEAYLTQVGARYPMPDPQYDAQKETYYLQQVADKRMPELEAQRKSFLSPDFDPGNNWWGSEPSLQKKARQKRPNILWIISDDLGNDLGCYGNTDVHTPNLDRLASEGVRFTHAYATSPVCSPSRSSLITGMYPVSINSLSHRTLDKKPLPEGIEPITTYFKQAGYFCANANERRQKGKEDYNFATEYSYDGIDWSERQPGQPFFAQIQIFEPHRPFVPDTARPIDHDKVQIPPYYPNHPLIRKDWAMYLESIQVLDQKVGAVLDRLEAEGLMDETVIIFFGDNGRPHLRDKQFLYEAGLQVPLIVRFPPSMKETGVEENLVSLIDVSATSLVLAGVELPAHLDGKPFWGETKEVRKYVYGFRQRMGDAVDDSRSITDGRYKLIWNRMPEVPWMQLSSYKKISYPAFSLYQYLHEKGELEHPFNLFMADHKPEIELYDLKEDPYESNNLGDTDLFQTMGKQLLQTLQEKITALEKNKEIESLAITEKGVKSGRAYGHSKLEDMGLPKDASPTQMVKYWEKELLNK